MTPMTQAIERGARRGLRIALDPTPQNFRLLMTPPQSPTASAWEMTGNSLRMAMQTSIQEDSKESSSRRN